jgi:hypothetical protein
MQRDLEPDANRCAERDRHYPAVSLVSAEQLPAAKGPPSVDRLSQRTQPAEPNAYAMCGEPHEQRRDQVADF